MPGVFLTEESVQVVISKFSNLKTIGDLADLLNWIENNDAKLASKLKANKLQIVPIDSLKLRLLLKKKETLYTHFTIEKKSGNLREIRDPFPQLKRVQRLINCLLQIVFEPKAHYCTNGFLYGRDIIRNAKPHVNKKYVLNCDIKDFFPSINYGRVRAVLALSPFCLNDERDEIGHLIANLCIYNNSLPQGAPTSPLLSNVVTQRLDRKLNKHCLPFKIKYSRYADDLSFSSNRNLFNEAFIKLIEKILIEENFQINEKKTRIKTDMERQQVTGLVVNEKVNIKREYIQKVRAMLNNWEKGGLELAKARFRKHQPSHKTNYNFIEVVTGHVSFIGNVRGKNDNMYVKLRLQLKTLKNRINYSFISNEDVRNRLIGDNLKMEKILLDKVHAEDEKYISFCTSAFHQIENLLNYYYWRRFPLFNDLLDYLILNNPKFKERHKTVEKAKSSFAKIGELNINVLVFIFEQEFYFKNATPFYDRRVTQLREIRNDESHRCSVIKYDKEKVILDFENLQKRKENFLLKKKRYLTLTPDEIDIEFKFNLLKFLQAKDYYFARKIVKEVSLIIKRDLNSRFSQQISPPIKETIIGAVS